MINGFFRVACASPQVAVADCENNTKKIIQLCKKASSDGVELLVLPELAISAYTCGDLFLQQTLISNALVQLKKLSKATAKLDMLIAVGCPLEKEDKLYNCAVFIFEGSIIAAIPKTHIPNYRELYELRHFTPGMPTLSSYSIDSKTSCVFGTNIIIDFNGVHIAAEIGEDLKAPYPPSTRHAQAGAQIICNLAASNEMVAKADFRRMLVQSQSARCTCAYLYANAGKGESTQDLIFSGHNIIAETSKILTESSPYTDGYILHDIDIDKIKANRKQSTLWAAPKKTNSYEKIMCANTKKTNKNHTIIRNIPTHPFVPSNKEKREQRCAEIIAMQAEGLAKRLTYIGCKKAVIGLSGGLDSTLALLVIAETFNRLGLDVSEIIAITMPCFGTTDRTYTNACALATSLGVTLRTISIEKAVRQHFINICHNENNHSSTYENAQARERTQVLMDVANQVNGIVIGTGDLSELALGWTTYNADHMSMYAINASIPKTLVPHLVAWFANNAKKESLDDKDTYFNLWTVLNDILDTPVSPELLPPKKDGTIAQKTERLVGPYELHDFFLYYVLRWGYTPQKIYTLALKAFSTNKSQIPPYSPESIVKWLKVFYTRFFQQQFKRSCMPDSVSIGTVNLSPRANWRMPSDASVSLWLKEIETLC